MLGEKGQRIRELTSVVQKRFAFQDGAVERARAVASAGCAREAGREPEVQAARRARVPARVPRLVRFVMESGAKGVEVVVSGKLRGQRAKAMKFIDGYMIKTGAAAEDYVDKAVRHVLMRQGVLGVMVKIMLPQDPTGKTGPKAPLSDIVQILEPKEELPVAVSSAYDDAMNKAAPPMAAY